MTHVVCDHNGLDKHVCKDRVERYALPRCAESRLEQRTARAARSGLGIVENPKAEFTCGQLGKAKRAFAKAGQSDASEEVRKKWLAEMKHVNIAVMDFTSSRLAYNSSSLKLSKS